MEEESNKAQSTSRSDSYIGVETSCSFNPVLGKESRNLIQILLNKDRNIEEKHQTLQQNEEETDNLRKNIVHLQAEYELLDHKYRTEISYREELEKKNETTRNLIETLQTYLEILASSIKMLDDDKFKITDFYNEIQRRQEATEAKRRKLEATVKEQDELINRANQITCERDSLLEQIQVLSKKISDIKDKLRYEIDQKNELERKSVELEEKMNKMIAEGTAHKAADSKLRKKFVIQKAKERKIRQLNEKLYLKRIKLLLFKNKTLKENLNASQEKIVVMNMDLELKYMEVQRELQKVCEDNVNKVNILEEKLNSSLCENENLERALKKFELELEIKNTENNKLNQEECETLKVKLRQQENELEKALEENSAMKMKIEELNDEVQSQAQKIKYFQLKTQNDEELNSKLNDLQLKMEKYSKLEADFQNKIDIQNENLCSQRSSYEMLVSEQQSHITSLEEDLARCKIENKNSKHQLDETTTKYNDLKNELRKKSSEIEKLKAKIIQLSSEKDIADGVKTTESISGGTKENGTSTVPSSSRKLLSTPVRLLQSPVLSPKLKTTTPILKKLDPYNFDSDSSSECVESDKVLKSVKIGPRKGNSSSKRGK